MVDTPETPNETASATSLPTEDRSSPEQTLRDAPALMTPQEILDKLKRGQGNNFEFPTEKCERAFGLLMERYQQHQGISYRELKENQICRLDEDEAVQSILEALKSALKTLLLKTWNGGHEYEPDPSRSGGAEFYAMEWLTENLRTHWCRCWSMPDTGERIFQVIDTGKTIPEEVQQKLRTKEPEAIRELLRIKCPDVLREVADVDSRLGFAFDCLLKKSEQNEWLSPQELAEELVEKFPDLRPSEEGEDGKKYLATSVAKGLLRKLCYIPEKEEKLGRARRDPPHEGLLHLPWFQIEQRAGAYKIKPRC